MKEKNATVSKAALRRQREKEKRYTTILDVAENLFAKNGYHQTSLENIAEAAEVSVGTVYFYFKNKEDLLISLTQKVGFQLRKTLGDAFLSQDGTLEGIVSAGLAFFKEFCLKYPERLSIFFREAGGQSAAVEEERTRQYGKLIKDLEGALKRVAVETRTRYRSPMSAELMAVCIMGIYERVAGYYMLWHDRAGDIAAAVEGVTAFTVGGIKNLMDSSDGKSPVSGK